MSRMIDRTLEEYASELESRLSPEIRRLIELANADLYHGPVYLDPEGEECSMWDDGAKPFGFCVQCKAIANALDHISEVYICSESGCVTTREPEGEWFDGGEVDDEGEPVREWCEPSPYHAFTRLQVLSAMLGRGLAPYVVA